MRNIIAVIVTAALLASAGPALAGHKNHKGNHHKQHYGHKHGHNYGHRHHRKHRRHGWNSSFFFAFPLVQQRSYPVSQAYVQPTPAPRARFNCQPTTGTRYINGRPATVGGTYCYDAYGQGYVVPGSEYFIGYQQ